MSRRLRSALGPPPPAPEPGPARSEMPTPLVLDLVAALVAGGAPPRAALRSVGAALQAVDDPRGVDLLSAATRVGRPFSRAPLPVTPQPQRPAGPGRRWPRSRRGKRPANSGRLTVVLEEALWLAARSGLPPTSLIHRCAAEERRRQDAAQEQAVRRLEVLLVVPAGLCLLPAFVLLGIVPVVIDLVLG